MTITIKAKLATGPHVKWEFKTSKEARMFWFKLKDIRRTPEGIKITNARYFNAKTAPDDWPDEAWNDGNTTNENGKSWLLQ